MVYLMVTKLEQIWKECVSKFSVDEVRHQEIFGKIVGAYSEKERHYHNLRHLSYMFSVLKPFWGQIMHWDKLVFSIFFHDYVYHPHKSNNEEKSAEQAFCNLRKLGISEVFLREIMEMIVRTKKHYVKMETDSEALRLLLDSDLAILGADKSDYVEYTQNVRREYAHVPEFIFNKERRKLLAKLLAMRAIYCTPYFIEHFEETARANLSFELEKLR